jgi:hypothetical protein
MGRITVFVIGLVILLIVAAPAFACACRFPGTEPSLADGSCPDSAPIKVSVGGPETGYEHTYTLPGGWSVLSGSPSYEQVRADYCLAWEAYQQLG